jgi:acyl dehydratase
MLYFEDIQLNQEHRSETYVVSKEEIIAFAKQWDPQPYHIDEEEAKKWPLGLTASSIHSYAICSKLANAMIGEPTAAVAGLGVDEMRMPAPVRPGDQLHALSLVDSKRDSKSKPNMGIITSLTKLVNQKGEVVLSYKTSSLIFRRP